jgi:hypothetical protein
MMLVKLPRTTAQAKSLPGYEAEKYLGNEKRGAAFTATPWFYWWTMKDSNLQPPDEEIPGRAIKFNCFNNFKGTTRVETGQTEPQNEPLTRLEAW